MIISTDIIHASLARLVMDIGDPHYIYDNPTRWAPDDPGNVYPAWYILDDRQQIVHGIGYDIIVMSIALVYLLDPQELNIYTRCHLLGDILSDKLRRLALYTASEPTDDEPADPDAPHIGGSGVLHYTPTGDYISIYEPEIHVGQDGLRCTLTLRLQVQPQKELPPIVHDITAAVQPKEYI